MTSCVFVLATLSMTSCVFVLAPFSLVLYKSSRRLRPVCAMWLSPCPSMPDGRKVMRTGPSSDACILLMDAERTTPAVRPGPLRGRFVGIASHRFSQLRPPEAILSFSQNTSLTGMSWWIDVTSFPESKRLWARLPLLLPLILTYSLDLPCFVRHSRLLSASL